MTSNKIIQDIQAIAKTKLLEEKIAKALSQSDTTINNDVSQSSVQSEKSIAVADGSTSTGATTDSNQPVTISTYPNLSGTLSGIVNIESQILQILGSAGITFNFAGNPLGNISNGQLSSGTTGATQAASNLNTSGGNSGQPTPTGYNGGQTGPSGIVSTFNGGTGGTSPTGTDLTGGVTSGGMTITQTGGLNSYNFGTSGGNSVTMTGNGDSTFTSITSGSTIYQNSSSADQQNFINTYFDSTLPPGTVTANQISNQNYSPNYNPFEDPLNSIIGFDPLGTISSVTGQVLGLQVNLSGLGYAIPTAKDTLFGSQDTTWTSASVAPAYNHFTLGKTWSVTNPEIASGATPSQAMDAAIASVHVINPGGLYTYAWWDVSSLTPSGSNYNATWYDDKRNPLAIPNVVTITGSTCTPPSSFCPLVAPVYSSWPKTGISMLELSNGAFGYSPFDSELPAYLKYPSSTVKLNCGDGHFIVNSNYLTIQPGANGGFVIEVWNAAGTFQWGSYYNSAGYLNQTNLNQAQSNIMKLL